MNERRKVGKWTREIERDREKVTLIKRLKTN